MTDQPKPNSEKPIAADKQTNKDAEKSKEDLASKVELLKCIVELVKAVAWPLFATIALLSFWGPLRLTVRQLPELVSRSETITVAGLSIEVQRNVSQQATEEVRQAVAQLSPDSISNLITMQGRRYYFSESAAFGREEHAEMIDLGLVEPLTADELDDAESDDREYGFGVEITSLGEEAQRLLLSLISEFTQELPPAE